MKKQDVRQTLQEEWQRAIEKAHEFELTPKISDTEDIKVVVGLRVKSELRAGVTADILSCRNSCW